MGHIKSVGWILVSTNAANETGRTISRVLRFDKRGVWWNFNQLKRALDTISAAQKAIDKAQDSFEWERHKGKIGILRELIDFLSPKSRDAYPGREYVWIPGIENIPVKHARTIMKLHVLLTINKWFERKEYRGSDYKGIAKSSDLRKAKALRRKKWSIPKIVDRIHAGRLQKDASGNERDKLIKRYQRAFQKKSG